MGEANIVDLVVNPHFEEYVFDWSQKTFLAVGAYGSSKSYATAEKIILKLFEEKRKCLVVRDVHESHKDSTFDLLSEILEEMGVVGRGKRKVVITKSPMGIRFPNGSRIIFKGLDKPSKLKSIANISIIWVEECSEISYAAYKELRGRLRHPFLKTHIILTTNPVSVDNWVYLHFFEDFVNKRFILSDKMLYEKRIIKKKNTYYHHSVAEDNYFLTQDYIDDLDEMQYYDPDLYRVARLGRFGVLGTRVLPQLEERDHKWIMKEINKIKNPINRNGMDFGFVESMNALLRMTIDPDKKDLYIYWEYYANGKTDDVTAEEIKEFKETKEIIFADSAEPKTIKYFHDNGFIMYSAHKFPGSRLQNTKKVKRFRHIYVSSKCPNTINELKHLTFAKDKLGKTIEDVFNIDPHTFSAIWYGLDGYEVADIKEKTDGSRRARRERSKRGK
ncbi:PBSX family phage terminase large subunit [Listeria ivanovii subsp. londoniensis]|uniref:PBSX family phage terminase large subunit n=1 Tax=Listeria ivanovii TaxID=1638 RepID=UPI00190406B0|nr:PBSX family phage terminase large subunit [Listeria ivanovii]MBK2004178.1 PBSX family phage terminase large subunit [Listeria ivanovii subsp. londoniensis]